MNVDFRKVEIEGIDGQKEAADLSKIIGNALYSNGKTLEVVELARAIWKDGKIEVKAEDKKILEEQIPQLFPTYIIQSAILNMLK